MSKKVLVNLDMNKNQLENVVIHNLATDPATGTLGQVIYNTAEKQVKQWNGSAWKAIGSDVDTALSSTSTNPVQNKVVKAALDDKANVGEAISDFGTGKTAASYTIDGVDVNGEDVTSATILAATQTYAGVMSAADKTKLDGIASGADKTVVDSTLSDTSENPVQNKVVKAALENKLDTSMLGGVEITPQQASKIPQAGAVIAYVANQLKALPKEQFLDLTKTTFVQSFAWSSTTYPDSTNPNLDGKPVMVLALKNSSDDTVAYSFLNMYELVDTYTGTSPITVSGRTVSHANSNVTAGSYGLSSNVTPAFGSTFDVPHVTVDAKGHVTAASTKTVTVPSTEATTDAAGLMSASDKTNLGYLQVENVRATDVFIAAGSTLVRVFLPSVNCKVISVQAYDSDGNEVIVDTQVLYSQRLVKIALAQAYTSQIDVTVLYKTITEEI